MLPRHPSLESWGTGWLLQREIWVSFRVRLEPPPVLAEVTSRRQTPLGAELGFGRGGCSSVLAAVGNRTRTLIYVRGHRGRWILGSSPAGKLLGKRGQREPRQLEPEPKSPPRAGLARPLDAPWHAQHRQLCGVLPQVLISVALLPHCLGQSSSGLSWHHQLPSVLRLGGSNW